MKKTMIGIALALLALTGCRQKDVREFTVEVPALTQTNEVAVTTAIRNALAGCCGIDMASLQFDSANHSLPAASSHPTACAENSPSPRPTPARTCAPTSLDTPSARPRATT